jgi:predicted dehydrogenase
MIMGGVHLRNWQSIADAQVVAVCDENPIAGAAKQGNLDVSSESLDLDGVALYSDVAEMLASEQLDAVSIALPTHLHKAVSIQCLEAGVHVLCEKPMALNVEDCDAMIAAAAKAGKHLMVAHCIRFWPVYAWAKEAVESGEYGPVRAADFSRLTSMPAWDNNSWLADPTKSGGIALDLHIHDLDFIQYLFGAPTSIRSMGSRSGHLQTWVGYDDDRAISATASWMMPASFGFQMAYSIVFEKAAAVFDGTTLTLYPSEGESFATELDEGDGYKGEIEYFASLLAGTNKETLITPEQSRESVRMALETLK